MGLLPEIQRLYLNELSDIIVIPTFSISIETVGISIMLVDAYIFTKRNNFLS